MQKIICAGCGKLFELEHPLQRYHSDACRMKAYRKRLFLKNLELKKPLRQP